jgi:tRNA U34 5-methylaminomethyl-2-thiouridine-forming methyltransferase MnmC
MDVDIIQTRDGSHSLLNGQLNETYHSIHGALQESRHVFIEHGLNYLARQSTLEVLSVFEVGFGTGLNALLAAEFAERNSVSVEYCSIERFPLAWEIAAQLNYTQRLDWNRATEIFKKIHQSEWNKTVHISDFFSLQKINGTIHNYYFGQKFSCIFFDAFAPEKQPDMWTREVLQKVTNALNKDGVLVTYCAKGQLRRDLISLQLKVETLPGPPGKREMTRAIKV